MSSLGDQLRRLRLQKGWNMDRLAAAAGISRTTLHHLERNETPHPHAKTLSRLANALEVSVEVILSSPPLRKRGELRSEQLQIEDFKYQIANRDGGETAREFDRVTNPVVTQLAEEEPALFVGWTDRDWDALYSTFATGGALREDGVRAHAAKINRRRDTQHQLNVLLETHLADVTAAVVESLYRQVALSPASKSDTIEPKET